MGKLMSETGSVRACVCVCVCVCVCAYRRAGLLSSRFLSIVPCGDFCLRGLPGASPKSRAAAKRSSETPEFFFRITTALLPGVVGAWVRVSVYVCVCVCVCVCVRVCVCVCVCSNG
jgi:hypothetical protein